MVMFLLRLYSRTPERRKEKCPEIEKSGRKTVQVVMWRLRFDAAQRAGQVGEVASAEGLNAGVVVAVERRHG